MLLTSFRLSKALDVAKKICLFQAAAFITSLPFLIGHGLAISQLSLIGNVLLNPVILIFMMLSASIFFCELLGLETLASLAINLLERLCLYWHKILTFSNIDPLFYLSCNHGLLLLCVTVIFCCFCIYKQWGWVRGLLSLYLLLTIALTQPVRIFVENLLHNDTLKQIIFSRGSIWLARDSQGTIIIKSTQLFKQCNRRSGFLDFELKPELAKNFGTVNFTAPTNATTKKRA